MNTAPGNFDNRDDLRPNYKFDYTRGRANRFANRKQRPNLIAPRIVVGVQLASLAAMVALSRADRHMLGEFNDLTVASSIPILLAWLFSLLAAPWIVIALARKGDGLKLEFAAVLLLELAMILGLLYAVVPQVQ